MAAFDYTALQAIATDLIVQFGQTATLRKSGGPSDAAEPWIPDGTKTTSTIKIVDLSKMEGFGGVSAGDGATFSAVSKKHSRELIISGDATVAPAAGDEVQIGGVWNTLLEVAPLSPAGTIVIWQATVET